MKKRTIQFCLIVTLAIFAGCGESNSTTAMDSTDIKMKDTGAVMSGDVNGSTTMKDSLNKMNGSPDSMDSKKDKAFLMEAAIGGMMEVEMGKLAATNASSAQVKEFGRMMVSDHNKVNKELKSLAAKKGIMIVTTLDDKGQQHINEMKAMKGNDFDKAYVEMMVEDHKADISKFEMEASGMDADVKAFAVATLPILRKHLDKINLIYEKMK
jgi:putative membrane protein